jgi:hypothetical protein
MNPAFMLSLLRQSYLQVMNMNALDLNFADDSFDYVMAFHTVTVVPEPANVGGGQAGLPSGRQDRDHQPFHADHPIIGSLTEALDPVTRRLGCQTKLRLEPFLRGTDFNVEEIYKLSKLSLYTVIVGTNEKEQRSGDQLKVSGYQNCSGTFSARRRWARGIVLLKSGHDRLSVEEARWRL